MRYDSTIWRQDLKRAAASLCSADALDGHSLLLIGASGLIGAALTDLLLTLSRERGLRLSLYLAGRDEARMRARFGAALDDKAQFLPFDATKQDNVLPKTFDAVVYAAGNADPMRMACEPVETLMTGMLGGRALLDAANERGARLLYVSSSEVYGTKADGLPFSEDAQGLLEANGARGAYAAGKRAGEALCLAHAAEYGTDVVLARPGHVYGPTALPSDSRVASAWAFDAAAGRDIVLKSDGAQQRSWIYCLDCATALLTVLQRGAKGTAYNLADAASNASIASLAALYAAHGGVAVRHTAPSEEERRRFNPMPVSTLEEARLRSLGWQPCFSLEEGTRYTVQILRETAL